MTPEPSVRDDPLPWHRALGHGLLVVAGWVLFVLAWWVVARRPWDSYDLTMLIAAAVLLIPAITYAWIAHNVAIYKRLGPRRSARPVERRYERDFNGRTIDADWADLHTRAHITIDADGPVKRYRASP